MCVVSMVGDHYGDIWKEKPWWPLKDPVLVVAPTIGEFRELQRQVEEMKALLKRAKLYDEANNEPDCALDDKMETLRKIAALVGIDLDDVLKQKASAVLEHPQDQSERLHEATPDGWKRNSRTEALRPINLQ